MADNKVRCAPPAHQREGSVARALDTTPGRLQPTPRLPAPTRGTVWHNIPGTWRPLWAARAVCIGLARLRGFARLKGRALRLRHDAPGAHGTRASSLRLPVLCAGPHSRASVVVAMPCARGAADPRQRSSPHALPSLHQPPAALPAALPAAPPVQYALPGLVPLVEHDPEMADLIEKEKNRQWKGLELIASEVSEPRARAPARVARPAAAEGRLVTHVPSRTVDGSCWFELRWEKPLPLPRVGSLHQPVPFSRLPVRLASLRPRSRRTSRRAR
jgi:hypothetical protein